VWLWVKKSTSSGFEPTYKELKQVYQAGHEFHAMGFEPTYKELKQKIAKQIFKPEKEF